MTRQHLVGAIVALLLVVATAGVAWYVGRVERAITYLNEVVLTTTATDGQRHGVTRKEAIDALIAEAVKREQERQQPQPLKK